MHRTMLAIGALFAWSRLACPVAAQYGYDQHSCDSHHHWHCKPAPRGEVLMAGPAVRLVNQRAVEVRQNPAAQLQEDIKTAPVQAAPPAAREGCNGGRNLERRIDDIERALLRLTHLLNELDKRYYQHNGAPRQPGSCPNGQCPSPRW